MKSSSGSERRDHWSEALADMPDYVMPETFFAVLLLLQMKLFLLVDGGKAALNEMANLLQILPLLLILYAFWPFVDALVTEISYQLYDHGVIGE